MMKNAVHQEPHADGVTLVWWERKPGDNPLVKFIVFSALGLIPGLALMAFMPGVGGLGAMALFTALFATLLTIPAVAGQRSFMRGLTKRMNDTLVEVTGNLNDRLTVKQLRRLIASGEPVPLNVNGVTGLRLQVKQAPTLEEDAPGKWFATITAVSPGRGVASFDRLLAATLKQGRIRPERRP